MNNSATALLLFLVTAPVGAFDPAAYRMVDLSHSYDSQTLYWPTSPSRFEKQQLAFGDTDGGWFYSAFAVCTPEHGGTHLDAPLHFAREGLATDAIALESLVSPGVIIDVSEQAAADRNYRLSLADVERFEKRNGQIPAGAAVLLRTGWSQYWPHARTYLGDDTPGDASHLQFPGFGEKAARWLIEQREIVSLGVDTASIDYGRSQDFPVHQVVAVHNIVGLENLAGLDRLPATGFVLLALPMKIAGGSGAPVRVVALVPKQKLLKPALAL